MFGNIKELIKEQGLSHRKEMTKLFIVDALICLFVIPIYMMGLDMSFLIVPPGLASVYTIYRLSSYKRSSEKTKENLEAEFVRIFTYFSIYIRDGFNVYHSLESILPFCSDLMKKRIERLLKEIDEDKSVTPFVNFGSCFDGLTVKEVMVTIYQMVEQGETSIYVDRFELIFGKFSEERHKLEKEKKMAKLQTLSILPLVGSGIVMLALVVAIMEAMGSFTVYGF